MKKISSNILDDVKKRGEIEISNDEKQFLKKFLQKYCE